ncbi:MAG: hypothetical protein OXI16_13295 [Chloroflexota bacterium]|nr:hypothetical protein [Chloroflexota bacterium]
MADISQFENAEEVRDYLRSELHRKGGAVRERFYDIHELIHSLATSDTSEIDINEVVGPLIDEWRANNPTAAQELEVGATQVVTTLTTLANELARVIKPFITTVAQWIENNQDTFRAIVLALQVLGAEGLVEAWRRRYEEDGTAIPFNQAVRLAFGLMLFEVPYEGDRGSDEAKLHTFYDYELRAMQALCDDRLSDLIEAAQSNPLDAKAAKTALRYLRQGGEPIPDELREWVFDCFDGSRTLPEPRVGRNPHGNEVRNQLIIRTVDSLVSCGLTATRNEVSPPASGCDAVSQALHIHGVELSYAGVAKVWQARNLAHE